MKGFRFLSGLAVLQLCGCATIMRASLESTPDPDYPFGKPDTPVVVMAVPGSENELQSRYYVPRVVTALRQRGYRQVVAETDLDRLDTAARLQFQVGVRSESRPFTYRSADYGPVPTVVTECHTDERRRGSSTHCVTVPGTRYGVIGYSDKTGYRTLRYFTLTGYDLVSHRKILQLQATGANSGCSEIAEYDFLATQALARMSFDHIVQQNFSVEMPDGYRCR